jgi:uncharacterized damage-inducible protein DinB
MPATYAFHAIDAADIPRAAEPADQLVVDVYASEVNKTASVWHAFDAAMLDFKPHPKSTTVRDIFKHELLSGRRFFGEFLGLPEPDAGTVVPDPITVEASVARLADLARARLPHLAKGTRAWWDEPVKFFDVERSRAWVFWRRILHSAHHRTQLTVYLRLLDRPVPPIYGPTADVSWSGADPTRTVDAARRA